MTQNYTVKTDNFEGPLELLLHLIEKKKLHINDISLSNVTDDFLNYIQTSTKISFEKSAHFIETAATLVLLKSKSLLPGLALEENEEADIKTLEHRLNLYKKIRAGARVIQNHFQRAILFSPAQEKTLLPGFYPDKHCTLPTLHAHMAGVVANLPLEKKHPEIHVAKAVSLDETIKRMTERISSTLSLSFKKFLVHERELGNSRVGAIVGFLALLELMRRGAVDADQEFPFSDIAIRTDKVSIPRYQ